MRVGFEYAHTSRDGRQKLVYTVYRDGEPPKSVCIDVDWRWLFEEASINDLKRLAIEEAAK